MNYALDNPGRIAKNPHDLGEFNNVYDAMRKYPKGGASGDYISILGVKHFWNVNRQSWGILKDKEDNLVQMVEDALNKVLSTKVELRQTETELQWRVGDEEWKTLILLSDIAGATTIGGLTNIDNSADVADKGSILVMGDEGVYHPNTSILNNISTLMAKVFPFTISSFSGGGTYELGSKVDLNLAWSYDREIESQSINGQPLPIDIRSRKYTDISTNTTYTLTATSAGMTVSKSVSATFRLKKYYGTSSKEVLTNSDILSLPSTWAQRVQSTTTFNCIGGKYPYYILPTSMVSGIQFWIGGLRNTDWLEEVREVTNTQGYKESYTIFRLNNIQTGVLNIEVK